ncbi:carbohydrate-binding protein [Agarivorans litoreus]|uniref:carbohydrate-binding protein n=1 Tax=Agarivorans litoreus TaxID=1510455 RepID=UPI001C7DA67D|nr:carbohydrate-binding protein [Agarivorans litoreus]
MKYPLKKAAVLPVLVFAGASLMTGTALAETIRVAADSFAYAKGDYADGQAKPVSTYTIKGKKAINYVNKGDLVGYNINVAENGVYDLSFNIATATAQGSAVEFQVKQDGKWVSYGATTVNAKGWDNYSIVKSDAQIPLKAGSQEVRVLGAGSDDWQWNLQYFELNKMGELAE